MQGALGSATTRAGRDQCARMCSRAAAWTSRAASACALVILRGDLHALGDARAEARMLLLDEAAVDLPDLVGLDDPHRVAPGIEAVVPGAMRTCCGLGSTPAMAPSASRSSAATGASASAKASSAISSAADRRGDGVAAEQHRADAAEHARRVGASQPMVSNDGDMSIAPLVSTRPSVVRMP